MMKNQCINFQKGRQEVRKSKKKSECCCRQHSLYIRIFLNCVYNSWGTSPNKIPVICKYKTNICSIQIFTSAARFICRNLPNNPVNLKTLNIWPKIKPEENLTEFPHIKENQRENRLRLNRMSGVIEKTPKAKNNVES